MVDCTLFLTLRIFSATGGIEKVSRVVGKALHENNIAERSEVKVFSMYDNPGDLDEKYFPASIFKGFGKNKAAFVLAAVREGVNCKQVILSHVNLLLVGYLVKKVSPKTKLVLMAHGIEIWDRFPLWRRLMLQACDQVLAVSNYTKTRIIDAHQLPVKKIQVLNNCLDPFLEVNHESGKSPALLKRYGLGADNLVLITLTRLAFREQYKGYDRVVTAVGQLTKQYPSLRYLIVGKYDLAEKNRMDALIKEQGLMDNIIFTGFIPEDELAAHYNLGDCYIMPSKKEGFGIVFIEAMFYGKPVIAGNKDGSVDALDHGKFGVLVDPDNQQEITNAIRQVLDNQQAFIPNRQDVLDKFEYTVYREKLKAILNQ